MNDAIKQPWDKKKWRDGVVRPGFPGIAGFLLPFSLAWLVIGLTILYGGRLRFAPWNGEATGLLLCIGIWAVTFLPAAIMAIRWAKWRGVELRMATIPGVVGGKLKAELLVPEFIQERTTIRIRIVNEQLTEVGSGKNRHTETTVLYEDGLAVETSMLAMEQSRFKIPVEFVIPFDTTDATSSVGNVTYRWRMVVTGEAPGLDMEIEIDIPVFKTPQSDPSVKRAGVRAEELEKKLERMEEPRNVIVSREADGEHFVTGGASKFMKVLSLLIIGAIMLICGIALVLVKAGMLKELLPLRFIKGISEIPWWAVGVVTALGALFTWMSIYMSERREVWVSDGCLCWRKGTSGKIMRISCDDIARCEAVSGGANNGKAFYGVTVYYSPGGVDVTQGVGNCRELSAAVWIDDKTEAEWLAKRLQEKIVANNTPAS